MIKSVISFVLLLIILPLPQPAQAEPSSDVKWLMKEPASLFDLGMLELDKRAQRVSRQFEKSKFVGLSEAETTYEFDRNLIFVTLRILSQQDPTPANCLKYLNPLRVALKGTGERFGHWGYRQHNRPKELTANINEIVRIKVILTTNLSKKQKNKPTVCRSGLE